MKPIRFRKEKSVGPRGFSRWVQPQMSKYLMVCCDCALVHEMQFRVAHGATSKNGQFVHVQFRARRAEIHTARERKRRGIVLK